MKILILSSSRDEIDDYYKSIAKSIAGFLSKDENDLIFGAASSSMMGICYNEFKKQNRTIYAYTTPKYIPDLDNLVYAEHFICKDTFEMKKNMFDEADMIIALPGGVGTLSEILAYIEENRSNDRNKSIIIYNEGHYYDNLINIINEYIKNSFVSNSILDSFNVASNKYEFEDIYYKDKYSKKGNR